MVPSKLCLLVLAMILAVGCSSIPAPNPTTVAADEEFSAARGMQAPSSERKTPKGPPRISGDSAVYKALGPFPINLADVPVGVYDPFNKFDLGKRGGGRAPSLISEEKAAMLREKSMSLKPNPLVRKQLFSQNKAISVGISFDSLDYTDCCGGGGNVPPDPELAVGPDHIIAVVNVAFEIYDKSGNLLSGPTTFSSFFAGTPGCSNTGVFDPNAAYDEREDRFIIGIDGDGTDYCVAATTGSDPTGTWDRFAFATDINGNFFDFPHIGVGNDAIYMGSNQFGQTSFAEARVFAIEKAALYSGGTPTIVTHSTGDDGTPQPANLRGWDQGTWPTSEPHYIMTEVFDGVTHTVWSWNDPFGADTFVKVGDVTLPGPGGFPVDWPQSGSNRDLQGNDFRGQATEYRNGKLWLATTLACNPGAGTVNCVRWAQIDPTGPSVLESGIFGTDGEYRTFPSVAANHCDDIAIGYTKGSADTFPAVYVAGRESGDPAGTLQAEVLVKAGEITYSSFESSGPYRWGDYTKMTIDPDGVTFWYLGEYSKDTGTSNGRWGNYISSSSFAGCSVTPSVCGNNVIEGNEVCDGSDLGGETCGSQSCTGGGSLACNVTCDGFDTSSCFDCPVCDNDGVCELGEDCSSCANDCPSFVTGGATCGNGLCEAGDGEDCVSCPADCDGRTGGKPSNRFCCGFDDGLSPDGCGAAACNSGGFSCTETPVGGGGTTCCGDLACEAPEDSNNCALDCGAVGFCGDDNIDPGETCDGTDLGGETCSSQGCTGGTLDCAFDCSVFDTGSCTGCSVCVDPGQGQPCNSNTICCSGVGNCTGGKPSNRVCQ